MAYRSRPEVDATDIVDSTRRYRRFLSAMSQALLVAAALVDLSALTVALQLWRVYGPSGATTALAVLPVILGVAGSIAAGPANGPGGFRLAGPAPIGATVNRDDDRYWMGGLIYVNRDDPAVIVATRFGIDWTLNLGNARAWLLVIVIIAALTALSLAGAG